MEDEKASKIRGENWTFTLYPENTEDMRILEYITQNHKYAYIEHDSDYETDKETGEIKQKKNHIHVIIILENARELKSVAKELNLEQNRIEKIKSIRFMFRYLLHLDQPEKTEYEKEQIKTNVSDLVNKYCKKDMETGQVIQIFEYIYSIDRYLYYHEALEYALKNNLYASFRRGASIMKNLIDEHNKLYLEKRESERQKEMYIKKEIRKWEYEKQDTKNKAKNSTKA